VIVISPHGVWKVCVFGLHLHHYKFLVIGKLTVQFYKTKTINAKCNVTYQQRQ
jgi:hypothetical protein